MTKGVHLCYCFRVHVLCTPRKRWLISPGNVLRREVMMALLVQQRYTMGSRYNTVHYHSIRFNKIILSYAIDQALISQKSPHISPSRASYGVSVVSILQTVYGTVTGPVCMSCCCMSIISRQFIRFDKQIVPQRTHETCASLSLQCGDAVLT